MTKISFINNTNQKIKTDRSLKSIIQRICDEYQYIITSLNIIYLSDIDLLQINKQFLNTDTLTDIITFNYSESKNIIEGELYISLDRITENASKYSNNIFENELNRIIIHGILHLVGFNDIRKKEKDQMTELENRYLSQIVSRETPKNDHV